MLDPWIIDEIRKREDERRRPADRVQQQLPDESPETPNGVPSSGRRGSPERGVAVLDYKV